MVEQELSPVFHCTCELCSHRWDTLKVPSRCAGCKSPYWNRGNPEPIVLDIETGEVDPPERELISFDDIMNWKPKGK